MKKIVVLFFLFIIILSSTQIAFADESGEYDCRAIQQEEKDSIDLDQSDSIIRFYSGSFLSGFAIGDDIDNLTSAKYVLEEIIVAYQQDSYKIIACYTIRNSLADKVIGFDKAAITFAQYTNKSTVAKIERKTGTIIKNITCLMVCIFIMKQTMAVMFFIRNTLLVIRFISSPLKILILLPKSILKRKKLLFMIKTERFERVPLFILKM